MDEPYLSTPIEWLKGGTRAAWENDRLSVFHGHDG